MAGLRPCLEPRCPVLVKTGRCDAHGGPAPKHGWGNRQTATKRVTGRRLQQMRADLFEREPLCRMCVAEGRATIATIRDHIIPLTEQGTDDDENIQPLCQDHSDAKTREESKRGVKTSRFQFKRGNA